ncbi:BcpB protein [Tistrella mobilis]|uniref:BcpB protein n=1 Tax=Tistrella mobilis TaxID=171437 RepID=A0A162JKR7_9PROT|nr:BcpB protein [Tistrella mobilis]
MECPVTAPSPANQPSLTSVDWSSIPAPVDDGAAAHLTGARLPDLALPSTAGGTVRLADLAGWSVLYFYPMTGRPDQPLPEGWDMIPGARGCTPQSCAFRDHAAELAEAGVSALYGISTQDTAWQREAAERLHLPFPLLSDADLQLTRALNLPVMEVGGHRLIRRLTLITRDGVVQQVFYPVFPPDRNAGDVLDWLRRR